MIQRFQRCIGIKLFRIGSYQLEAWCCPTGEVIPAHRHESFSSRIIHILGRMSWTMGAKSKSVSTWHCGWSKPVPAGVDHSAVAHSFSVFLNLERWHSKPTSAAIDFHPA